MKIPVYGIDGKKSSEMQLPEVFGQVVRTDLIKRAVLSDLSATYQPKGNDPRAGMETSARYRGRKEDYGSGKNKGTAIRPREVLPKGRLGKVKRIPSAVKGRRAHPPHVEKVLFESMNKKEYAKAIQSALAATANKSVVQARGHKVKDVAALPIVFDSKLESVAKTKEIVSALVAAGLGQDLERAKKTKRVSGVGRRRAEKKGPKSAIVVVGNNSPLLKSARNIAGVDTVLASNISALDLAPGAAAGRLAVYTTGALEQISRLYGPAKGKQ
ncbi:50S ribosomal protein L4 [Candidatus Parvarchaeota archaeon]|nr:50S ribosomal protein L4 [Candidatus Parvarchaeota archaeon]